MKISYTNILLVVLVVAVAGLYFKKSEQPQPEFVGTVGSPVGTTFSTAQVAQINVSPTIGATSTGVLNTDSNDRYIETMYGACSNVGTSLAPYSGIGGITNWTLTAATGTSQAPATITNSNTITANISTSTVNAFASTTSMTDLTRIWPTGSYLNFAFNATNTAACTVGVHYIKS